MQLGVQDIASPTSIADSQDADSAGDSPSVLDMSLYLCSRHTVATYLLDCALLLSVYILRLLLLTQMLPPPESPTW